MKSESELLNVWLEGARHRNILWNNYKDIDHRIGRIFLLNSLDRVIETNRILLMNNHLYFIINNY